MNEQLIQSLADARQKEEAARIRREQLQADLALYNRADADEIHDLIHALHQARVYDEDMGRWRIKPTMVDLVRKLESRLAAAATQPVAGQSAIEAMEVEAQRPQGKRMLKSWGIDRVKMPVGLPTAFGGYSGTGKSRTAVNLAIDSLRSHKDSVLFVTTEMTAGQLAMQIVAQLIYSEHGTPNDLTGMAEIVRKDRRQVDRYRQAFDHISLIGASGWTASDVCRAYQNYVALHGQEPGLLVVDYLQRLWPESRSQRADRRTQVIETVHILTDLIKGTHSRFLLLCQTGRPEKGGAPKLKDFMESAAIEQDAGLALTAAKDQNRQNVMHIAVRKNRFGPSDDEIFVEYEPLTGHYLRRVSADTAPEGPRRNVTR